MFDNSQYGYVNLSDTVIVFAVIKAAVIIAIVSVVVSIVTLIVWFLKFGPDQFPGQTLVGSVSQHWSILDVLIDVHEVQM